MVSPVYSPLFHAVFLKICSQGLSIAISPPSSFTVTTSRASVTSADLSTAVPSILAADISWQLLPLVEATLRDEFGKESGSGIFIDELEEVIVIARMVILRYVLYHLEGIAALIPDGRLTIPAPFDVLYTSVSGIAQSTIQVTYTSREDENLLSWIRNLKSLVHPDEAMAMTS